MFSTTTDVLLWQCVVDNLHDSRCFYKFYTLKCNLRSFEYNYLAVADVSFLTLIYRMALIALIAARCTILSMDETPSSELTRLPAIDANFVFIAFEIYILTLVNHEGQLRWHFRPFVHIVLDGLFSNPVLSLIKHLWPRRDMQDAIASEEGFPQKKIYLAFLSLMCSRFPSQTHRTVQRWQPE